MTNILHMPGHAEPRSSCSWAVRASASIRRAIGSLLNRSGVPGAIKEAEFRDDVTGSCVRVQVQDRFTVVSIDGRDYFFDRLSGRFDGTGMGCA